MSFASTIAKVPSSLSDLTHSFGKKGSTSQTHTAGKSGDLTRRSGVISLLFHEGRLHHREKVLDQALQDSIKAHEKARQEYLEHYCKQITCAMEPFEGYR